MTTGRTAPDLRMVAVAASAWAGCLVVAAVGPWALVVLPVPLLVRGGNRTTLVVLVAVFLGAAACLGLRDTSVSSSVVHRLGEERASARVELVVRSDPRTVHGRHGDQVMLRAQLRSVTARGHTHELRSPVLVVASQSWHGARLGSTVSASGRLGPSDDPDLAAILSARGPPRVTHRPAYVLRGAERVRAGIRDAVAGQPPGPRALVPALVDGDDARMSTELVEDFRTTGLTHLTAVSGTNLTLLVGFLLVIARAVGVQARGLLLVGAVGVVGFVLLARTEPSVVRAAVMGSVALLGMGLGRTVGTRSLGVAVTVLLLVDPGLSRSPGFVLSVCATGGILFLAPEWRDRMRAWLPRWLAEAVAVPLAAQLACTPMVAALSGQVSLAAVGANMLVAIVVGPVTVFGLVGGLLAVAWDHGGRLLAAPGAWCARWIIWVATHGADLPVPAFDIGLHPWTLAGLTAGCLVLALTLGPLLGRRLPSLLLAAVSVVVVMVPAPRLGWPPSGWVAVMCDVGQGDALVVRTGPGEGLLVDAGPEPQAVDRCLDRLGVRRLEAVVLTHFHADHVDGLAGALSGRAAGAVVVSPLAAPEPGARAVHAIASSARVPVVTAVPGEIHRRGPVTWQVLAPTGPPPVGSESPPNDASVVLLVKVRGVSLLLMGDQETGSQEELARTFPELRTDVVKIAHHGSAKQDTDLLRGLGARLALVSVGADNDYGHPAPRLLGVLRQAAVQVRRTDRDGDVAVIEQDGLRVETSR